jgi:hypothetical protein
MAGLHLSPRDLVARKMVYIIVPISLLADQERHVGVFVTNVECAHTSLDLSSARFLFVDEFYEVLFHLRVGLVGVRQVVAPECVGPRIRLVFMLVIAR